MPAEERYAKPLSYDPGRLVRSIEVLTPRDPARRGSQISVRVPGDAESVERTLRASGVVVDVRPPDVVRFAAAPLYNSARDVWTLTETMESLYR